MRLTVRGDHSARSGRQIFSLTTSLGAATTIVLLLLVIGWLDFVTGTAPIQHLYYLPIILAALIFDYWGGMVCALVAIIS